MGPDEVEPPHYADRRAALPGGESALARAAADGAQPAGTGAPDTTEASALIYLATPHHVTSASLAAAREAVVEWLADEASDDLAADLKLIVSELVTNALRAAATTIRVTGERRTDRVEVRVYDDGAGWPRPLTPSAGDIHGRGLKIVAALAGRWGVTAEAGGKTVWAEIAISA